MALLWKTVLFQMSVPDMRRPMSGFERISLNQVQRRMRTERLRYSSYPDEVQAIIPEQVILKQVYKIPSQTSFFTWCIVCTTQNIISD